MFFPNFYLSPQLTHSLTCKFGPPIRLISCFASIEMRLLLLDFGFFPLFLSLLNSITHLQVWYTDWFSASLQLSCNYFDLLASLLLSCDFILLFPPFNYFRSKLRENWIFFGISKISVLNQQKGSFVKNLLKLGNFCEKLRNKFVL